MRGAHPIESWTLDVGCWMFFISFQQARPPQRRQKILFDLGKFFSGDGIARDQHQFDRLGKFILVLPETFAQQPPRPAAHHRAADFAAGDDAQSRRRAVRQRMPVGDEAAQREPLSLLPHAREIALLLKPRRAAQPQASGFRRLAVWRLETRRAWAGASNGRQAFAAHAAAVAQRGAAALGGFAGEKSVLPFAADFRRLILAFHKSNLIRAFCAGKLRLTERRD